MTNAKAPYASVMSPRAERWSPLAFAVLATLAERPMHAYGMHRTLADRGKAVLIGSPSRASLYPVLERLVRNGLVEVASTERETRRPERTVYRVTEQGRSHARELLLGYLASPSSDSAGFVIGLSFMMLAEPRDVAAALLSRRGMLASELATLRDGLEEGTRLGLPSLFQLDETYRLAITEAALAHLDSVTAALEDGALTWDADWIAEIAARSAAPRDDDGAPLAE